MKLILNIKILLIIIYMPKKIDIKDIKNIKNIKWYQPTIKDFKFNDKSRIEYYFKTIFKFA